MAISDVYTDRSGATAVTGTSATPLVSVIMGTTLRGWVVGVRTEVTVTGAAAGNSLLFQLARPGNTLTATSGSGASPHDFSAPASIAQQFTTYSTAPTVGTILAEWSIPQTTGSMWEEFPPTGYEWGIPATANSAANAGVHLFVTMSVTTATTISTDIIFSE